MRDHGLHLEARRGDRQADWTDRGVALNGETRWVLTGPELLLTEIVAALPESMHERLGPVFLLDFGNAVGRFEVPHIGTIEVKTGKWSEQDYEAMVADIASQMSALPFAAADTAKLAYGRELSSNPEVLYQAFVYLRHILSDAAPRDVRLEPALEAVLREPHSRLVRSTRRVPLARAGRVDAAFLTRLAAGEVPMSRSGAALAHLPVSIALGGRLPDWVDDGRVIRDFDTAENRFAKSFLELATALVDRMEEIATAQMDRKRFWRRVHQDCVRMRRQLVRFRRAALWHDVGAMVHLPASSTVLQRRRGYREVYEHYLRLRATTRLPLDPDRLADLLEVKDVADLYEIWCYFQVVAALTEICGAPTHSARYKADYGQVSVPWSFVVEWGSALACHYNLHFSRSARARHSYSVQLRPDIAIEIAAGPNAGLHLMDAKFKLQKLDGWDQDDDETERRSTFKRADLYKMHTYRDAIPRARSVRILYPGQHEAFFPRAPGSAEGVGAIPLAPGRTEELARVVRMLVASPAGRRA